MALRPLRRHGRRAVPPPAPRLARGRGLSDRRVLLGLVGHHHPRHARRAELALHRQLLAAARSALEDRRSGRPRKDGRRVRLRQLPELRTRRQQRDEVSRSLLVHALLWSARQAAGHQGPRVPRVRVQEIRRRSPLRDVRLLGADRRADDVQRTRLRHLVQGHRALRADAARSRRPAPDDDCLVRDAPLSSQVPPRRHSHRRRRQRVGSKGLHVFTRGGVPDPL